MRHTARRRLRLHYVTILGLIAALLLAPLGAHAANGAQANGDGPLTLISELRVGEGTLLKHYNKTIQGKNNKVLVTEIDLHNPYVKIAPIFGKEGKIAKQPLTSMANENGAVAAINANFFHLTQRPAPFAMQYQDGELITSQSILHDWMVFSIDTDQVAQIGSFGFSGRVTASNNATFPIFNLNKEVHNTHDGNSHENRLNVYNSRWGGTSLGTLADKAGVVEVVVTGGIVTDIRIDQAGVAIPDNGYVLMGHGTAATFLLENVKMGEHIGIDYRITPDASNLAQAIGAHALLVDGGAPVTISPKTDFSGAKTARARSAIGMSHDGKKVYFIVVEKSKDSNGVNLETLAKIIAELGVWRAANLDGGGSTTLVSRLPGDATVSLLHAIDGGSIRSIPDGIAVYNLAPAGKLAGIQLNSGPQSILVGSKVTYTLKGYDEHVLPYNVYQHPIQWGVQNSATGAFVDGRFVARASGKTDIFATVAGIRSTTYPIEVFGGKDIDKIEVSPSVVNVLPNYMQPLSVTVKTKSGVTFKASADNIKWTVDGVDGTMDGLTYRANAATGVGQLKGTIDGFTFTVPVHQGVLYSTQNTLDYVSAYSHSHYPSNNAGSFTRVDLASGEPVFRGVAAMKLTYNFLPNTFDEKGISTDAIEAAYGNMNDPSLTFQKDALGFGVSVYGDRSSYALKAHIKDNNGKIHYVTLAEQIDWDGWRYVEAPFTSDMARPVTLTSLYVVDEPNAAFTDRPLSGSIYFDEILLLRPYERSFVGTAKTVTPNSKDKATDLALSIGAVDLSIQAQHIEKRASSYTVTSIVVGKHARAIRGEYPYAYGFELSLKERESAAPSAFPITLTPKGDQYFDLLTWTESEGAWKRIVGYPNRAGGLQFELTNGGTYIPVKSDARIPFVDIANHWARTSIVEMARVGIIKGTSANEYSPAATLSRGEIATLIYRLIDVTQPDLAAMLLATNELTFVDPIPEWAQQGAIATVNLGAMNGVGENKFAAGERLTREQLATIIERAVQSLQLEVPAPTQAQTISDQKSVSTWATAGVTLSTEQRLFPLVEGKFMPQQPVTRGETAYAIAQLYQWIEGR